MSRPTGAPGFGPATAAVLALLWLLVIATVVRRGLHVPLGSVPERLFTELNCSMLVIPVPD